MCIPVPEAIRRIAGSEDRVLAWNFFVMFSRMEYALKRSGYLKNRTDAQANWDTFGTEHKHQFDPNSSIELKAAVDYFLQNPPRKQLRQNGNLEWSEPQQQKETDGLLEWLLRMICCVRNNLFHGGKFPLIPISDPSRDRELLLNAMFILAAALSLDLDVQTYFNEDIES